METILSTAKKTIQIAVDLLSGKSLNEFISYLLDGSILKQAHEFMEYQRPERSIERNPNNDRVFPLDSVSINNYRIDNQSDIETANIHIGDYANELAMRMNALALAFGYDIYFRNGAYRPETEEGRKILAHELTHVDQHNEKRITPNADRETLEKEAEYVEAQSEYDPDPYELFPVGNKVYKLRRSQIKTVDRLTADFVEEHLAEQKHRLTEKDYLYFLCSYSDFIDEVI